MLVIRVLLVSLVLLGLSCSTNKESDNNEEARLLFHRSAQLIKETTHNMKIAADSASIDSLSRLYEKKITEINFSFAPETDFKLTEQENDSLFKLIGSMKTVKYNKLKEFSIILGDSLDLQDNLVSKE